MKKQIIHISPVQTAKVFAVLYFVISVPIVVLMAIGYAIMPGEKFGIAFLAILPFMYALFGFVFCMIGAAVYNLVAGWVGGIEYTAVTAGEGQ